MEVDILSLSIYSLFFLVLSLKGINGKGRWRQRGMVTAFIVALFTEMWGFPLSLFIITSLGGGTQLPYQFDNLVYYFTQTRNASDLAFFDPPPAWVAEYILARGLTLLSLLPIINGWFYLKRNIDKGLVTNGPYRFSRNPQYIGFIMFVIGMTLYWPTLITIPMGCILCFAYYKLTLSEEKSLQTFDAEYYEYSRKVPRFFGKQTYKIFRLPKELHFTEKVVTAALLIPFILWFGEAIAAAVLGTETVRMYWFPLAYFLPVHMGVLVSLALLIPIGTASLLKGWANKKRDGLH